MSEENQVQTQDTGVSAEPETASESPAQEQTGQEPEQQTETPEVGKELDQKIPYDRFKEKVEEANTYKQELERIRQEQEALKAQETADPREQQIQQELDKYLKRMGYVSQQDLERQRRDEEVRAEVESLEKKYNGSDGRPKFDRQKVVQYAISKGISDVEAAYKTMHEQDLINWHVKNALNKTKSVPSEKSDGSGTQEGPNDLDLLKSYKKGNTDSFKAYLRSKSKLARSVLNKE